MSKTALMEVFSSILEERIYQDEVWGTIDQNPHEVSGWLLILEQELHEAKEDWVTLPGNDACLREILQVAAVATACLQQYGVVPRAFGPTQQKVLPQVWHWRTPEMLIACGSDQPRQHVTSVLEHVTCCCCRDVIYERGMALLRQRGDDATQTQQAPGV